MISNVLAVVILLTSSTLVLCQRPSFAGSRPIGFPDTPNRTTTVAVGDRFGDDDSTTPRLPIEANGDLELIDRLSKLPVDKQPFWFINWQALEAHRKNPQTHVQRPNGFIDPIMPSQNAATAQANSNAVSSVSSSGSSNSTPTSSSVQSNANAAIGDRFDSDVTNVKPTSTVANKPGAESTVTAEPYSLQWFVNHYSTTTKKTDAKTSR
ncbi:uncharacterized protein LOC114250932 isoform X2 [Bombyx mandarina]|uniref:Uncharacterized protein LOC114250932 isoform X2 n=1 Tax=Bombyx mandarina TaxID=7092 RepID=A0A6J2KES5_BOMMA|nr:uncharacterized protein LOC114250932 isoform X2 [Bombyx mandarina]